MKKFILFCLVTLTIFANGCGGNSDKLNPRTILIVMNGLASGAIENERLVHLQNWEKEGCFYQTVYSPLPAHPDQSSGYSWSCPLSDPVMMTGTIFIGQSDIKNNMIQQMFGTKKTAFIVNDDSYEDLSQGFDLYYNLKTSDNDMLKDELVFNKAKEVLEDENPSFLVMYLKGPGVAGLESSLPENKKEKWYQNIWQDNSPYVQQLKRDDQLIEEFINWLEYEGYWESATVFITGNNGQATTGGCPPDDPASSKTELLIIGKDVKPGAEYDYAELTDLAPTIIRINNLSSLRYSKGRVLEEAFKWGPSSVEPEQKLKKLNEILINHRHSTGQLYGTSSGFLDIDQICEWHKNINPVTIDEFIRYEEKH